MKLFSKKDDRPKRIYIGTQQGYGAGQTGIVVSVQTTGIPPAGDYTLQHFSGLYLASLTSTGATTVVPGIATCYLEVLSTKSNAYRGAMAIGNPNSGMNLNTTLVYEDLQIPFGWFPNGFSFVINSIFYPPTGAADVASASGFFYFGFDVR